MLEIVAERNPIQKVLSKISQNSPRSVAWPISLLKKETPGVFLKLNVKVTHQPSSAENVNQSPDFS